MIRRNLAPNNFAVFRLTKHNVRLELRLEQSEEIRKQLDESGIDLMDYDTRWGRYRLRLTKSDIKDHADLLTEILRAALLEARPDLRG